MSRISITQLEEMKQKGEKIAMLTSYDASFTRQIEEAGIETILIGDSLGMVIQGHDSTIPVTVDDIVYHVSNVARVSRRALLIADMPFLSDSSPQKALATAKRLMKEGGAQMVKLEGAGERLAVIETLASHSVPVCGHLGLLPQSVFLLGGYRVQGREEQEAQQMLNDAIAIQDAGAQMLVLECVPRRLAEEISKALVIPVIGIGAGAACDGQVLVVYDMLGITPGKLPKFVKNFLEGSGSVAAALKSYNREVKEGTFPESEHAFL
ncbi:3-methyl-2-oxobutanoate hydroxymethyltransferase [Solemya velum gill symbiont]|uniref:3-methyl-2-oxobutanoate hydroxymethyltransferase n=3 Tax=Solemya velum gill symbiont TaxID=2340 RepID=A0A0B0HDX9_SOVGS|nr:3-methyl-2-oxobutanoate hydroxymethyltransferase [Solemya velum gill symbiont]KHF25666.1 ketopantoate hydroxymethyltransferase [Solemya velum gill symbiont]OOY35732.1 3-methyl-2-oxobutanoate hydroxymethyltransferase [Solemya velum gill symbiont]OOY38360.1 3-methyl-2-oxobutanoate hydroxymethyltransferase [Solemya velum gill symbiont]OOY40958.1 3-methyl-2-oxobutanoate hydroxymethyltransferase [Solemya velum gill symbiont]OOY42196.1 3-methyl-2-oxobutanoate hydroxymethyltransferase [Solemya vel